jgi:nitric oxide dioxygenase
MLSAAAKPYIDASVPVLRQHGLSITTTFYNNMLNAHPELNNLFNQGNQANGSQQQSLASAVFAYAANIENASALAPVIERIVHKHVSIGVLPSHYPIVGKYLLGAIKEVLGDAATPELMSAWDEAYWLLAGELIATEARLYESNGNTEKQWLKMKVLSKQHISPDTVSITLIPNHSESLPNFKAGQYISIAAHIDELNLRQIRQYSLSDAEQENHYRITVKQEKGSELKPEGKFSKWIHQHVAVGSVIEVSHPYGTFVPDLSKNLPITMISAGVGITPMLSILKTLANKKSQRKVSFIHAARSVESLVHYEEIDSAKLNLKDLKTTIFISEESSGEFKNGRMNLPAVLDKEVLDGEFYICGPTTFMDDQWKELLSLGVNPNRIEREVFGPESLSHLL